MSLLKQVEDLKAQLAEAQAASTTAAEQVKALDATIASQTATIVDGAKALADLQAKADSEAKAAAESLAALKAANDKATADLATATAEIDKCKQALAHPAFADAAMVGVTTPPKDTVSASDGLTESQKAWAAYQAISDPKQRTAFYRANRATLIKGK